MDTLTKRDIQTRMHKIMNDLETAGEISTMMRANIIANIKTETDKLEKMKKTIETLEKKNNELEETVSELENDKEKLEQSFDTQTNKLKTEVDVLITTKDSLQSEITEIKDTINSVFSKGIYEDEYYFEKCDYVLTYDKDIYKYGKTHIKCSTKN